MESVGSKSLSEWRVFFALDKVPHQRLLDPEDFDEAVKSL
jgi:hypothetical protein